MSIPPSYPPLPIRIRVAGQTDQGRVREHNEDDYRISFDLDQQLWGHSPEDGVLLASKGALMVVADGMGGAAAGEVASRIAVEEVKSFFTLLQLPEILTRENIYKILEQAFVKVHEALLIETEKMRICQGWARR
ncbi:MAG: protein phosphatase 2C domain-containing protein [Saprospiraceae bacterium]|nr:protein phosphatase 2C domain-containing protein [Saprospiraceae bacterium]